MPLLLQATTRKRASSRWTNVNKRNQLRTPWNFPVNVWFTPIQNYLPIERVYSWILLNRTTTNTSMMNSFPLYFRFFILTINAIKKQLCGLLQCLTDNTIPHLFLVNWPVFFSLEDSFVLFVSRQLKTPLNTSAAVIQRPLHTSDTTVGSCEHVLVQTFSYIFASRPLWRRLIQLLPCISGSLDTVLEWPRQLHKDRRLRLHLVIQSKLNLWNAISNGNQFCVLNIGPSADDVAASERILFNSRNSCAARIAQQRLQ